ncbi:MAG: hypothetical protein HZA17_08385 [Nitrospirae bacterium]|nr:hypothetical protein [Nitrospirota bacterium]
MRGIKTAFYLVILSLIIFSGCAKKEAVKSLQDEEVLKQRVMSYWNHKISREFDKAYSYEDPVFRKKSSLTIYLKQYDNPAMTYTRFEVQDIKLNDAEHAEVKIKTDVRLKVPGAKAFEHDTELTELWVRVDGEWYHVPKGKKSLTQ